MGSLKTVFLIINFKSLWISALAVVSTYLCIKYQIIAEFPLPLVLTAVVFPIVFSIDAAYKRREVALDHYGDIKAHVKALYLAVHDWRDNPPETDIRAARSLLIRLLEACRVLFTGPVREMRENEKAVYAGFAEISRFIRTDLRDKGVNASEISRCNQYLSKIMVSFEKVKHIYQYRTPRTLNAFRNVFIIILPFVYGPYFAFLAKDFSPSMVYVTPVLISVVLASLDNIQTHLENPFDRDSEDDLKINVEQLFERMT
jgi:predicted membrane chloride channel (bestrophin family)